MEHLAETYRAFLLRRAARRAEILRLQQKVPTEGEAFALLERCLQTAEAAASPPTLDDTDALLRLALGVGQVELDGKSGPGGRTLEAELFGEEEPAEGGAEGGHVLLGKKGPRKVLFFVFFESIKFLFLNTIPFLSFETTCSSMYHDHVVMLHS